MFANILQGLKFLLTYSQAKNPQLTKKEADIKVIFNNPIVHTRSLDKAKQWLREHARGSERFGLLASSKAERLKAIGPKRATPGCAVGGGVGDIGR